MNDARAGLACFFIDRAFNFRLQAPAFNSQILEKSSSEPQWMMVFWMWPCAPTLGGRWVRVEFSPAPLTFVGVRMLHDNQPVVGDSREKNSNNRQYWQTIQVKHYFWTFAWLVQKISSYVGREYKINSNTVDNVTTIIQRLPCDIILEINYKLLLFCNLIIVNYDMYIVNVYIVTILVNANIVTTIFYFIYLIVTLFSFVALTKQVDC